MRKLLSLLVCCVLIFSCAKLRPKVQPIEKYKNKGYVVIEEPRSEIITPFNYTKVYLKCKDSLFIVYVPIFDGRNLKVGDTL